MTRRAVFVDRDGTLNELVRDPVSGMPESPLRPEDVQLIPGAAEAVRSLAEGGWMVVGISNQPAAAKGTISMERLLSVQERVLALLREAGAVLDDFRLCLHHPDGVVEGLSGDCDCRKPLPGLLLEAASANDIDLAASWMIGDTDADVLAGDAAGCRTVMLEHAPSGHRRTQALQPTVVMPDLAAAAVWLLRTG